MASGKQNGSLSLPDSFSGGRNTGGGRRDDRRPSGQEADIPTGQNRNQPARHEIPCRRSFLAPCSKHLFWSAVQPPRPDPRQSGSSGTRTRNEPRRTMTHCRSGGRPPLSATSPGTLRWIRCWFPRAAWASANSWIRTIQRRRSTGASRSGTIRGCFKPEESTLRPVAHHCSGTWLRFDPSPRSPAPFCKWPSGEPSHK